MSVGKHFGLYEATQRSFKKNEATLRNSVCSETKLSIKPSSYTRERENGKISGDVDKRGISKMSNSKRKCRQAGIIEKL
ncbi:hypothetical protein NPIL_663201 [Nephila pilipes]|uniref:Uncharacterized protein n=1 Tax=Nephila pilipes TaxID=299642 RepID=A0A8X6UEG1_NEPPI|nr:hypothetical protein NPIL_663201 [Nephila pilipes]